MSITNGYVTLAEIKEWLTIPSSDALDDQLLERAVEASSRAIDDVCGRRFYADTTASARRFRPADSCLLQLPDISSTTGLLVKLDDNADGTFEVTVASSDYQVEPSYVENTAFTAIRLLERCWPHDIRGRYLIEITAKWGWPTVPTAVKQATLILASRVFKRKNSPEGVLSFADAGVIRVSATDRDVQALIQPYVLIGFA